MSRPNEGPTWSCDKCGAINPPKNLICWRCGGFHSTSGPTLRPRFRRSR